MVSMAWRIAITCSYFVAGIVLLLIGKYVAVASLFLMIGFVLVVVVMSVYLSSKNTKLGHHRKGAFKFL